VATRGAKGRKGLTGKRNTAAAAFLAQLLPPQTFAACGKKVGATKKHLTHIG